MIRFLGSILIGTICLAAPESRGVSPVSPGFMEGYLKIEPAKGGAELGDESKPKPATVNYAEYPLVILRKGSQEQVAQITADAKGHYRVPLPPGDYVLSFKAASPRRGRGQLRPFTVVSQQTVRVDMELMPDLSVSGAPR